MILPLLLPLAADAATFEVCPTCTYTTIADAARAASEARSGRSTIRIAAGEYDETETITVYGDATIVGDGSDVTIVRSTADPAFRLGYKIDDAGIVATVSVSDLALEASAGDGIHIVRSAAEIADIRAENVPGYAVYSWRGPLEVVRSTFAGNGTAIGFFSNVGGFELTVSESEFLEHTDSAIVAYDGPAEVSNSVFRRNTGSSGAALVTAYPSVLTRNDFIANSSDGYGGAVYLGFGSAAVVEKNRFCGNSAEVGGALHSPDWFDGIGNVFVENTATTAGGDVSLGGGASLLNNTFVGSYAPQGGSVYAEVSFEFRNNIVAHTSMYGLYAGPYAMYATPIVAYNDFWNVSPDTVGGGWSAPDGTNLAVDPMFVSYVEGGCEELDLGLLPGSPLYDAGDPTTFDADGTVADIGATGGDTPVEGTRRWYRDADGDGYGALDDRMYGEAASPGYVGYAGDCEDTDAGRNPGEAESCDGVDEDCDGAIDESPTDAARWYHDADGDGFQGDAVQRACEAPEGWEERAGERDCADDDATVFPGAAEVCDDDVDQDCDGQDLEPTSWHVDADGDGYQAEGTVEDCEAPDGWGADSGPPYDCDDDDASMHAGADEIPGDGYDQDCDGRDLPASDEPEGCRGCSSAPHPSGALVLLAALVLRRRRAGPR